MKKSLVLASFVTLALIGAASAQELKIGLVVQPSTPKEVSRVVEEIITIQNNSDVDLDVGVLEVILPAQTKYQFSNTSGSFQDGQKITWNVPQLDSGASYLVRFVVMPQFEAKGVVTNYKYLVAGKTLGQIQIIEDIAPKGTTVENPVRPSVTAGQVRGAATTLPVTGADPMLYFFLLLPAAFIARAIR